MGEASASTKYHTYITPSSKTNITESFTATAKVDAAEHLIKVVTDPNTVASIKFHNIVSSTADSAWVSEGRQYYFEALPTDGYRTARYPYSGYLTCSGPKTYTNITGGVNITVTADSRITALQVELYSFPEAMTGVAYWGSVNITPGSSLTAYYGGIKITDPSNTYLLYNPNTIRTARIDGEIFHAEIQGSAGLKYTAINNGSAYEVSGKGTCTTSEVIVPYYYPGSSTPVTRIGDSAFYNDSKITAIVLPSSITDIGNEGFYSIDNLTSIVLPNSLKTIGARAFYTCSHLQSISILNSVTSIGDAVFASCQGLTSMIVPTGVSEIPTSFLYACSNITYVKLPKNITSIGAFAFYSCKNLQTLTFEGTLAQWELITKNQHWNYTGNISKVICSNGSVTIS